MGSASHSERSRARAFWEPANSLASSHPRTFDIRRALLCRGCRPQRWRVGAQCRREWVPRTPQGTSSSCSAFCPRGERSFRWLPAWSLRVERPMARRPGLLPSAQAPLVRDRQRRSKISPSRVWRRPSPSNQLYPGGSGGRRRHDLEPQSVSGHVDRRQPPHEHDVRGGVFDPPSPPTVSGCTSSTSDVSWSLRHIDFGLRAHADIPPGHRGERQCEQPADGDVLQRRLDDVFCACRVRRCLLFHALAYGHCRLWWQRNRDLYARRRRLDELVRCRLSPSADDPSSCSRWRRHSLA